MDKRIKCKMLKDKVKVKTNNGGCDDDGKKGNEGTIVRQLKI